MLTANEVGGLMAMMPAFATDNAGDIHATSTVDVARLHHGLDRMIRDGANVIATTGSFGECHTLLPDEFRTLAHESVIVVKKRVPLFIGVTSVNSREAVAKIKMIEGSGADGILLGVPYYFPSSLGNAIRFYKDIGEMFPKLNIMIYHNPALHHVTLPVEAFKEITKNPAVVAMKDSHRTPEEFVELQKIVRGKISMFVFQGQYATYAALVPPGCGRSTRGWDPGRISPYATPSSAATSRRPRPSPWISCRRTRRPPIFHGARPHPRLRSAWRDTSIPARCGHPSSKSPPK